MIYITKAGLNELSQSVLRLGVAEPRPIFSRKTRWLIRKNINKRGATAVVLGFPFNSSSVTFVKQVSCDLFGSGFLIQFWQSCWCSLWPLTSPGWIKGKRLCRLCNFTDVVANSLEKQSRGPRVSRPEQNRCTPSVYVLKWSKNIICRRRGHVFYMARLLLDQNPGMWLGPAG